MVIRAAIRTRRVLAMAALLAAAASAQAPATWTGPDLKRVPKKGDIIFAISEVCLPHLTRMQTIEEIASRQRLKLNGDDKGGFVAINNGDMVVELRVEKDGGAGRMCEFVYNDDALKLFATARNALAQWPAPMSLAIGNPSPEKIVYLAAETHCSPPDGAQYTVLMTAGMPGNKSNRKRFKFHATSGGKRDLICDQDTEIHPQAAQ